MPEGHTIHRYARDHHRWFAGQELHVSSPQGRFSEGAERISDRSLVRVEACGKHLFYVFEGERHEPAVVHVHLGLYGSFRLHRNPAPAPRGQIRMRCVGEERTLDLSGPTRCEVISWHVALQRMTKLGPDPLRKDSDPQRFFAAMAKTRRTVGATLLDQQVIAGVGNIYRAELLFYFRLNPWTPSRELEAPTVQEIWEQAGRWLALGVRSKRIITTLDPEQERRWRGLPREEATAVYRRSRCPRCQGEITRGEQANRILYWCVGCQGPAPNSR